MGISAVGTLRVKDSWSLLNFTFPSGLKISAMLTDRFPWDVSCPETCGPEGWAHRLPSSWLPTHYFVQTLASHVTYEIGEVSGSGFAHQEANYGGFFPDAWTWVQGASSRNVQLVLTGGAFTIAGVTEKQFIIGYRSSNFSWDFRNIDLDSISADVDGCNSTLRVSAQSRLLDRRLEIEVSAANASFSDPLYFPTPHGWSNSPG